MKAIETKTEREIKQGNWFDTSYRIFEDDVKCYFSIGKTEYSMNLSRIKTLRDNLTELIDAVETELVKETR